jgi:hypothetical protein
MSSLGWLLRPNSVRCHICSSLPGFCHSSWNLSSPFVAGAAFFDLGSNASNLKAPIELGTGIFDYGYMAGARIFSNSWGEWFSDQECFYGKE